MKICFVTNNIADKGGVQRVLSVVANGLSDRYEVSILMTSPSKTAEQHAYQLSKKVTVLMDDSFSKARKKYHKALGFINKKIVRFHNTNFLREIYFPRREINIYNQFFERHSFDVIIGVQPRAAGIVSLLDTKAAKFGWMHNTYDAYFESPQRYQWRQDYLYKILFGRLDKIIVLTDHDKKEYEKKLNQTNVVRIYNPLSFTSETKSPLNGEKLVFVGRFQYEQKGLGLLIDVIKNVKREIPNISVDVIGDGPDKKRFIQESIAEGVDMNLNFKGMVDNVQDYYRNGDLFLLTSKYEGFGLVVTEAMECGLPVVSFKTEGPSEIIFDGENGFLIDMFDVAEFAKKVVLLCHDGELRRTMGKNAQRRARDFSVNTIMDQWHSLFVDLEKKQVHM